MKRLLFTLLLAWPAAALDFQDRDAVVAAALETHPTLARMRAEAGAARERVTPAASLPNPMLMAGVQNKQVDLRDDEMMTMYMVGISQTLIRPEKRDARRESAELAARAAEKSIDSARAEIERDVLLAWYDLAAADAQLHAIEHLREMTGAVTDTARFRYEVGTAAQADVIRAQLQVSDLEQEILRLRATRRAAQTRVLTALGLPMETEVPRITALSQREGEDVSGALRFVQDETLASHPAVAALQIEAAAVEQDLRLAQLELRPDVDLEAQYGYRAMQRDMFSVTARIELPLRSKQLTQPRIREAIARRDALNSQIEELRRSLKQEIATAVVAHDEAAQQLEFQRGVLLPQSQLAFESTLAAYQTGKAAFDAILTTQTAYLRLRLQSFDFLAAHAQAQVSYEALLKGARSGGSSGKAGLTAGASRTAATSSSMGSME